MNNRTTTIELLDTDGLVVASVSGSRERARAEGRRYLAIYGDEIADLKINGRRRPFTDLTE